MSSYSDLVSLFAVERVGASRKVFRPAQGLPDDDGRLLGAVVLGLAMRAAAETAGNGRRAHSLHSYFLRPGRASRPLALEVERVRDGRSFSLRRISATQDGKIIASIAASYVLDASESDPSGAIGDWHVAPSEAGDPEAIVSGSPVVAGSDLLAGFDVRAGSLPGDAPPESPIHPYWARVRNQLPDDSALHTSVVVLLSDCGVSATACRPGTRLRQRLAATSLDHAVWFHRPLRTDEWMLVSAHSVSDAAHRGFAHASVHARDGRLAASIAQEALLARPRTAESRGDVE
jgi:acyl-CoA thioesterase II